MNRFTTITLLCLSVGRVTGDGLADDDHDTAYHLRQDAAILPLETIMETAGLGPDARILEVEAEFEHGRRIYEIAYVTAGGRVMEVEIDARTGEVLKREEEH
jgi:uncharacterized membrane protein YkoI